MARPELWTTENSRLEIAKYGRQLKLIPLADENDGNDSLPPVNGQSSPNMSSEEEAEGQRLQFLASSDTWYNNMDTVLRSLLLNCKISTLTSMSDFIMALHSWLGGPNTSEPCSASSAKQRNL